MLNKFKILLIALLFSALANAQDTLFLPRFETQSMFFETAFSSEMRSNTLPNSLLSKMLLGGKISDADKDLARFGSKNAYLENSLQAHMRLEQLFVTAFDIKNIGYSIAIEQEVATTVVFDQPLYTLALHGNESFFESPFQSSEDAINNFNLSHFKLGLIKTFGSQKHKIGLDLGYALVWNYFDLSISSMRIDFGGAAFTTPNYTGSFNLNTPDTAHLFDMNFKGQGFTLSMQYRYDNLKNIRFGVKLVNFGRLYFPKSGFSGSKEVGNDSMLFYIPNILDPSESIQHFNAADSLKTLLFGDLSRQKYAVYSPADIYFDFTYLSSNNLQYGLLFQHRFFANWQSPKIALSVAYSYKKRYLFGALISKSDFNIVDLGLFMKTEFKNGIGFSIGSNYLSSIFIPKHASGLGGFATFTYKIKSYD